MPVPAFYQTWLLSDPFYMTGRARLERERDFRGMTTSRSLFGTRQPDRASAFGGAPKARR
jgi:hypothetical protein